MMKMLRRLVRIAPLALLFVGTAMAQGTSSITGVVTDASTGKPVVGAVIVVTSPAVQGEQTVVSEAGGKFTVPNLPAGDYKLAVQMDGYKPFERADLVVKEATTLRANAAVVPEAVQVEEVVVTGSRIRRKDLTTPAPVSVINAESIQASGKVTVADFLQSLPEQGNSLNTQYNNGGDGSVNIGLRSLGSNRTLVLVNGRRMVAGGTTPGASVDLNTIPAAAIERIEILKDGASAVYGSDAIAGVVNIILKKKYDGIQASAYAGTSSHGDGQTYDVSAIAGTASDKGSIMFSLGYQQQKKIIAGDREWAKYTYLYNADTGQRTPTGQSSTFPAGRFSIPRVATTCATTPSNPVLADLCAKWAASDPDPTKRTNSFVPDFAGGFALYDGSSYNTYPTNYLLTPNRRIQIFSAGEMKLGDAARAFFEASYVNRTSSQDMASMPVTNLLPDGSPVVITADSYYNPTGVNITSWRRRLMEFGPRHWQQDLDTFHLVTGLDGTIGDWAGPFKGWSWDVSYNYGRTSGVSTSAGQLRMSRIAASVGRSGIVSGRAVCLDAEGNAIFGCVPLNVIGLDQAGNASSSVVSQGNTLADLKKWLSFDGTDRAYMEQQIASADLSGDLFKLWSENPVALAVGADFRIESGGYMPDAVSASGDSSGNNQMPTRGKYDVKEGYAELSIPVVSNAPGIQDLELSAAVRYFDYSTFGSDKTWKFGARYSPVRDLTVRGTYSTAFRAPNVQELFGGAADSYEYAGDPCFDIPTDPADPNYNANLLAACAANGVPGGSSQDNGTQFLTHRLGNPDLKPETAKIFTLGLVVEPRWLQNLSITLDYYDIEVKKMIGLNGTQFILNGCYPTEGQSSPEYCGMIHRDESGIITYIDDLRGNLTTTRTSGVDLAGRYQFPTQALGRFTAQVDATYLIKYDETFAPGTAQESKIKHAGNYDGSLALPRWKANFGLGWQLGGFDALAAVKYVGSYSECTNSGYCSGSDPSGKRTVKKYYPLDLTAGYNFTTVAGKTAVSVGVSNVADAKPPYVANAGNFNSDPSTYDYIGRYFWGRLTQSF